MLIIEDNDPTGYTSGKAIAAKKELKIEAFTFPRYSPDLNPLDFYVWHEVGQKRLANLKGPPSVKKFKKELRRIALALPEEQVRAAAASMKKRAASVVEAKGGDIARD